MRHLILVRHSYYDDVTHRINKPGRIAITGLVTKLQPVIKGQPVVVFSSPAIWVRDSAELLASILGVSVEIQDILRSSDEHPENLDGALELVKLHQHRAEVLVFVTHYEYANHFPYHFGMTELQTEFCHGEITKGTALVIDCVLKTLTHVIP